MALTKATNRMHTGAKVNVLDYIPSSEHTAIAAGTSTYDAASNIQSAINDGGRIFFPKGRYAIGTTLVMANRTILEGETAIWAWGDGGSALSWIGAANGVMVQAATQPLGTVSTTSLSGTGISNLLLQGNDVAGIGLYCNYTTNESIFYNVSASGCNLYGFLLGKIWYGYFEKIVARNCDGIGVAIGDNYLSTYDDLSVNGTVFRGIRGARCGQAYNASTAPTGFDLTSNPEGGCGILVKSESDTGYEEVYGEGNYGPGLVINCKSYTGQTFKNLYIENNMDSCVADGTSTHQFGTLLYNESSPIGQVDINGFYGHEPDTNYRFYYLDGGGNLSYRIRTAREIEVITTSTGELPISTEGVRITSTNSGYLDDSVDSYKVTVTADDKAQGTDSGTIVLRQAENLQWDNGDTIKICDVEFNNGGQRGGSGASLDISIMYQGSVGLEGNHETIVDNYRISLAVPQRYTNSVTGNSDITQVSTVSAVDGSNVITPATPTVTWSYVAASFAPVASIRIAPTSLGADIYNRVSVSIRCDSAGMVLGRPAVVNNICKIV